MLKALRAWSFKTVSLPGSTLHATLRGSCAKTWMRMIADPANYTQSLGCWHGFIAQQKMISIKKHFGSTKRRYLYLSGWMVAALRSEFGPLPDQSMHEKTSVPALIEELYTFLKQADARELGGLFRELDAAKEAGDAVNTHRLSKAIDEHQTHVVPIIADIDAGFGNAEATYLLAKKMIEAGACALQIENQVSDEKQCGHQDGKVTVPHEDFLQKIRAIRYAFLELGVPDGIIVARTDQPRRRPDQADRLLEGTRRSWRPVQFSFLDCDEVDPPMHSNGQVFISRDGKLLRPKRLPSNLYQFRPAPGRTAAFSTASPRCRTVPTCCGSKPKSRMSTRSAAWSIASARPFPTPSWSTTIRPASTGR